MIKHPKYIFILFIIITSLVSASDTLYLTLNDAVDLALHNNKSIMIAQEKVKAQSAGKNMSRASFLPSVNLSGTYTRLAEAQGFPMTISIPGKISFPVYDLSGNIIGFTESIPTTIATITETLNIVNKDNYYLGASVTQTLFTWGKLVNAYQIAGLSLDIEKESYQKALEDLKLQVTQSFYQTMLADKGVKLMTESYAQMQRHTNQIDKLYQSGMVGQLDLLRAKVQLSNFRSQLIRIENTRTIAYSALKMVLGIDTETPVGLQGEYSFDPYQIDLDEAITIALQERPDLQNMRRTVSIAQKGLAIQRTANLPSIFSAFNYSYSKPLSMTQPDWGPNWNATIGASMPLSLGGANFYKMKQSKAQLNQVKLGLAMLEDAVKLDVQSNYFNFEQEKEILSYQAENVQTAEQALTLAEEKYRNGLITNLEFIDTQLALTQAKFEQLNSIANCIISKAKLLNAIGQ
ncbi:MAG: TolC family protein [Candidatus Latescibacteria bacterium]|nr:TolC family protein [Candidatus Latescibacterota bacterium]